MDGFRYVLNSSRPIASIRKTLAEIPVELNPVAIIGAMGTEIAIEGAPDLEWQARFEGWDRSIVDAAMERLGADPHADEVQTPFKASYAVPEHLRGRARKAIESSGQPARIIASGMSDFDVLPPGAGKGAATLRCVEVFKVTTDGLIVAGDSANDLDLFRVARKGIVVGNARDELRRQVSPPTAYHSSQDFAAGVIEGLEHWGITLAKNRTLEP